MIVEKVNKIIENINPLCSKPCEKDKLKDDLGIDSLRLVELLVELEDKLGISFQLSDLNASKLLYVSDIHLLVKKYT